MKLYIIYILILAHIEWTFGIRCYSCASNNNNKQSLIDPCLNPAENVGDGNVHEIDCLNTKLCWKAVTGGTIRRGCGEKRCAFIPDISMGSLISQTCCSNDLCNRTSSLILSKSMICSISFLIIFFRLFY